MFFFLDQRNEAHTNPKMVHLALLGAVEPGHIVCPILHASDDVRVQLASSPSSVFKYKLSILGVFNWLWC